MGNRFAFNGIAVHQRTGRQHPTDNILRGNLTDVVQAGRRKPERTSQATTNRLPGLDRNGDGIGDTPYELYAYADRIWIETPAASSSRPRRSRTARFPGAPGALRRRSELHVRDPRRVRQTGVSPLVSEAPAQPRPSRRPARPSATASSAPALLTGGVMGAALSGLLPQVYAAPGACAPRRPGRAGLPRPAASSAASASRSVRCRRSAGRPE